MIRKTEADVASSTLDKGERQRIPMSVPVQKLEVPPIPGYYLYWIADRPGRVQQAIRAGYEFVTPDEAQLNNTDIAGDATQSGNTDLGNRVSIMGGVGEDGNGQRLYLMKLREEYHLEDQKVHEARSDKIVASLRGGQVGASQDQAGDADKRYIPKQGDNRNIFTKRRP